MQYCVGRVERQYDRASTASENWLAVWRRFQLTSCSPSVNPAPPLPSSSDSHEPHVWQTGISTSYAVTCVPHTVNMRIACHSRLWRHGAPRPTGAPSVGSVLEEESSRTQHHKTGHNTTITIVHSQGRHHHADEQVPFQERQSRRKSVGRRTLEEE